MANPNPSPETRFRPGWSGGPGRPRSRPVTDRLRERLADDPGLADELLDRWLELVRAGDVAALRLLMQYLEGRPEAAGGPESPPTVADAIRALDRVERALGIAPPTEET